MPNFNLFFFLLFHYLFNLVSSIKIPLERHSFFIADHPGQQSRRISLLEQRKSVSQPEVSFSKRSIQNNLLFSSSSIVAPFQIGTPAQKVFVLLDTASADLAIFGGNYSSQFYDNLQNEDDGGSQDQNKVEIGPPFNYTQSTSFQSTSNQFTNNYGSGSSATSFTAFYATDTITFEEFTLIGQPLGVIESGNVSYGPAASGILGLAFESASLGLHSTPTVQELLFSKALKQPVFSFALMRPSVASEQSNTSLLTQPGGIFTLGELDQDQFQGSIGWSKVVSTQKGSQAPTKWLAQLDGISVNGGDILPESKGIVANFDTGSSVSRGSAQLINAILSQANNVYKDDQGNYYVPCGENIVPQFNLTISMGGVSIPIEPMDMLFKTAQFILNQSNGQAGNSEEKYCYSTLTTTTSTDYDLQIGDDVMRSMFVAFSFNPPQVGIALQSDNVRNQGAKPSYAFTKSRDLDTSSLNLVSNQPGQTLTSKVGYVVDVDPSSAIQHISSTSIHPGGTYAPQISGEMGTMTEVIANMTPEQVGPVTSSLATNPPDMGIQRDPEAIGKIPKMTQSPISSNSANKLSTAVHSLALLIITTYLFLHLF